MYSVYFCWNGTGMTKDRLLWHPVGMPSMSEVDAKAAAIALAFALPAHQWAYGPTHQDGLTRV